LHVKERQRRTALEAEWAVFKGQVRHAERQTHRQLSLQSRIALMDEIQASINPTPAQEPGVVEEEPAWRLGSPNFDPKARRW
jgi:hypothetical protein